MKNSKRIVVRDNRFIRPLNNVQGPILTPARVDIETIGRLVIQGYNVFEYISGRYEKLGMHNYDKDNRSVNETLADNRKEQQEKPVQQNQPKNNNQRHNNNKNHRNQHQNKQNQPSSNKKIEDTVTEK